MKTPRRKKRINVFKKLPTLVIGGNVRVPVLGKKPRCYVNFDNAASTPTLKPVLDAVNKFLPWYSNVHRGTGFKSKLSSWAFEESRRKIYNFVKADPEKEIVLFSRNTTESINHLANRFPFKENSVVLTTVMEHHSNELPWRRVAQVVHINVLDDGRIDEEDFSNRLSEYRGRISLVAVTGASNVTGYINPIHKYAQWAHEAGAKIFIDAAQLVPHHPIDMMPAENSGHLDFIAFSAHKMYAPFGVGVLIGDRKTFEMGDPDLVGGGAVDIVNLENAYWTELPDKEEAGTPDIVGAVALGAVINLYEKIGWKAIIKHEAILTSYALSKMKKVPGISLYGDTDPKNAHNRLGVISFNVRKLPHALVASILSCEWGIGTRNGCFCAHPYVKCLLRVNEEDARVMEQQILARDRSTLPGTVRISFGIYNTKEEIDYFCEALKAIAQSKYRAGYTLDKERGEYCRNDFKEEFNRFFGF